MNEEREKVYQILELGKHIKNLHHKKGFGGLLFIDLSMIKFSKLSSYIRQLDKENQELKEKLDKYENPEDMTLFAMWCTEKVKDENEKLKKHLKVPKACNLKTLEDYKSYYEDTTREQILEDTYIEYCAYVNLAHRYSELKEQLENCYCNRTDCSGRIKDSKVYDSLVQKVETQQKEFIKYLESYLKLFDNMYIYEQGSYDTIEEILQKYKSIIGDDK